MGIEVRSASLREMEACVELQLTAWGFTPRDVVPLNQLRAAQSFGGSVIVAVDGGQVVGFVYGFGGRYQDQPSLCSHMMAVLSAYRGQGLAIRLKVAQAEQALREGYKLITWTFDPLEALNANLNLGRLGGTVRRFLTDYYGKIEHGMYEGHPTDRLLVEWHLSSPRVLRVMNGNLPGPAAGPVERTCEVPLNFQALKQGDPVAALQWRLRVRSELTVALEAGLAITGFRMEGQVGRYELTRQ